MNPATGTPIRHCCDAQFNRKPLFDLLSNIKLASPRPAKTPGTASRTKRLPEVLLSKEQIAQECDATMFNSSNTGGNINCYCTKTEAAIKWGELLSRLLPKAGTSEVKKLLLPLLQFPVSISLLKK